MGYRVTLAMLAAIAFGLIASPGSAPAFGPIGADMRISTTGVEDTTTKAPFTPWIAYNSVNNEYLVVWDSDSATDNDYEVVGQRMTPAGGLIGSEFQISDIIANAGAGRDVSSGGVAYNSDSNEYLVVWRGDELATNDEPEVFGQRLSSTGAEIGTDDFRISNVGTDTDAARAANTPIVGYSSSATEYLVAWAGDQSADDRFDIYGQRVDADGSQLGGDFQISNAVSVGTTRDAADPSIAYNPTAGEFLIVFQADELTTDNEYEIYGQRVTAGGGPVSVNDFRFSNTGTDNDAGRFASNGVVTYNSTSNEYLTVWRADGLTTDDEDEIFGQRVTPTGTEAGSDFRISNTGADTDSSVAADEPAVAANPLTNEYLVTFEADGLGTQGHFEIFGQRLGATGNEIDTDFRISTTSSLTDANRQAFESKVAFDPVAKEYMTVWYGDALAVDNDIEIFGRRIDATDPVPATPVNPAPVNPAPADNSVELSLTATKKQKAVKKKSLLLSAGCAKEACTVAATGTVNIPGTSAAKKLKLGKVTTSLAGGAKATLKLKLSAKARKAIKKALKKHAKVSAQIVVTATDTAKNQSKRTVSVQIVG